MEFNDLNIKTILNKDDYIVGCDGTGKLFRISVDNLKSALGVQKVEAERVIVQYSFNKESWHSVYTEGDRYMRVKCGSGAWSSAICISVSAYETWREANGGKGTVEEFLLSLKGEAGASVDVSKLQISDMGGYKEFATQVSENIDKALSTLGVSLDKKLDAIEKRISELEATDDRVVISLTGDQNGKNVVFGTGTAYVVGTSQLYINGKRNYAGSDYLETSDSGIVVLTHVPEAGDVLVFTAVKKPSKE